MFSIKNVSARQHTLAGVTINPGVTKVLSFDDAGYESKVKSSAGLKHFTDRGELVIAAVKGDYKHGDDFIQEVKEADKKVSKKAE